MATQRISNHTLHWLSEICCAQWEPFWPLFSLIQTSWPKPDPFPRDSRPRHKENTSRRTETRVTVNAEAARPSLVQKSDCGWDIYCFVRQGGRSTTTVWLSSLCFTVRGLKSNRGLSLIPVLLGAYIHNTRNVQFCPFSTTTIHRGPHLGLQQFSAFVSLRRTVKCVSRG